MVPRSDTASTEIALANPLAHQRGAVDRVDREVAVRAVAVADLLAVVEHRRVVFLALADHHDAAHRHRVDQLAHRVDRGAVAALLVAATDPAARRHRAGFRYTHKFEGEVAVRGFTTRGASWKLIVPLAGRGLGAGILAVMTTQPQPAPKPPKPRLLQDGRDMFWSIAPLVAACIVLAGVLGMCSFQPGGPGPGPTPSYDAPAALRADADALKIPIRVPRAARRGGSPTPAAAAASTAAAPTGRGSRPAR